MHQARSAIRPSGGRRVTKAELIKNRLFGGGREGSGPTRAGSRARPCLCHNLYMRTPWHTLAWKSTTAFTWDGSGIYVVAMWVLRAHRVYIVRHCSENVESRLGSLDEKNANLYIA